MRRVGMLALVIAAAAVAAAGAFFMYWLRGLPRPVAGIFPNGMAYMRFGGGPKNLVFIPGGPGNVLPAGWLMRAMSARTLRAFLQSGYTVWAVARKRDMPTGYSIEEMAEDYAGLIADEFDGKVDLVIGETAYGGMIGLALAARHPDRFDHLVTAFAGSRISERGRAVELEFARLMSEDRRTEAATLAVRELMPSLRLPLADRVFGWFLGRMMYGELHPYFASDVVVEADAVAQFDGRELLPTIEAPVLVVGSDRDFEFSRDVYEETARLIPDSTLRIYEGVGPNGAMSGTRFALDVLDWVGEPLIGEAPKGPARAHVRHDIWIKAPVEEVFALYCDTARWPEFWLEGTGELRNISGPIDQVGTTFEGTMRVAGKEISGTMRVVQVEPDRLVRYENEQGELGFTYRFEAEGDGTRFVHEGGYSTAGLLGKLADRLILRRYMDQSSRYMLEKMKEIAEAPVPAMA